MNALPAGPGALLLLLLLILLLLLLVVLLLLIIIITIRTTPAALSWRILAKWRHECAPSRARSAPAEARLGRLWCRAEWRKRHRRCTQFRGQSPQPRPVKNVKPWEWPGPSPAATSWFRETKVPTAQGTNCRSGSSRGLTRTRTGGRSTQGTVRVYNQPTQKTHRQSFTCLGYNLESGGSGGEDIGAARSFEASRRSRNL